MEGNFSARATHGPCPNPHRGRDVPPGHSCLQLTVAYDGSRYFGWQKTSYGPSIQQELETAWQKLTQESISMDAISRTDRGVHAEGQIVQFSTATTLPPSRIPTALNSHLPKDIRIKSALLSSAFLHPLSKTYRYTIHLGPVQSPFLRHHSWHYPYPIDLAQIEDGAPLLIGTHDFSSFSTEPTDDPIRTLHSLELSLQDSLLTIRMTGDRFLYKMARTIAGTLANLGSGKISKEILSSLLDGRRRSLAGVTAPPHGLCLEKIVGV